VNANRELFFREIDVVDNPTLVKAARVGQSTKVWPSVAMKQIHSSIIHQISDLPEQPLAGDGLITRTPKIVLTVRTADCIPVLLVDPVQHAVGAFHAGWRGTLARIVEKGVGEMRKAFRSQPEDMLAAIGPGIHRCCYEVSEDLKEKFTAQFAYADDLFEEVFSSDPVHDKYPLLFMNKRAPGHGDPHCTLHLDLVEANHRQLLDGGLAKDNIWISDLCTSCRTDLLFSHRKEHGKTGRLVAAIAIAPA
jgi:YfiH family protein